MADTTHASLRALLEEERDRIREQLAQYGYGNSESLKFDEGFADSGAVTAERGEVDALVGALKETLAEVEAALDKIETGAYGMCEACGDEINLARLEAAPAARLCIDCASKRR